MKKAFKISAVILALIALVALSVVLTVSAEETWTDVTQNNYQDVMANGGNFRLTENISAQDTSALFRIGQDVTLDLNGYTIESSTTNGLFYQYGLTIGTFKIVDNSTGNTGAILAPNATLIDQYVDGNVQIFDGFYAVNKLAEKPIVTIQGSGEDEGIVDGDGAYVGKDEMWGTWISLGDTTADINASCRVGYHAISAIEKTVGTYTGDFNRVVPQDATITYKYVTALENGVAVSDVTLNNAPALYDVETADITIANLVPTKRGYTFVKWYIYDEGSVGDKYFSAPNTFDCEAYWSEFYNITLVGVMDPTDYIVNYEFPGGELNITNPASNPTTFTNSSTDLLLLPASKDKATFEGWYYDATFQNELTKVGDYWTIDCSETFTDLTLYGKFDLQVYEVKYNLNGGSEMVGADGKNPTSITVDTAWTLNAAYKPGYTFTGWYNEDGEKVTAFGPETDVEAESMILTAGFDANKYTVIYVFGIVDDADITNPNAFANNSFYVNTPTFDLPAPTVSEELGYEFTGWVDENGNPITEIEIGTIPANAEGTVTVTAQWKLAQYRITFNYGIGVSHDEVSNPNLVNNATNFIYFDKTQKIVLKDATRGNLYTFEGWYYADPTAYPDQTPVTEIPVGTTHNVMLYAKWAPAEFKLNYDPNGFGYILGDDETIDYTTQVPGDQLGGTGEMPDEDYITTYTWNTNATLPVPTREGYLFKGWYVKGTDNILITEIKAGTMSGDKDLIAVWETELVGFDVIYIYNQDWQVAHPNAATILPDAATGTGYAIYSISQYFGLDWIHNVEFTKYNGFVPEKWIVNESMTTDFKASLESYPEADKLLGRPEGSGKYYVVFFEPVVYSTTFNNNELVVTYFDGSTQSIDLSALSSVKLTDTSLVYVTSDGKENVVASVAQVDTKLAALQAEIAKLNTALDTLKSADNSGATTGDAITDALKAEIAAEVTKVLGTLPADVAANTANISALAERVAKLETLVADLAARTDALEAKDTTLLIVIIVVGIIAAAAAVCVVILFVKKK